MELHTWQRVLFAISVVQIGCRGQGDNVCDFRQDPRISWGTLVDCSNRGIANIPSGLPHNATSLLLDNNKIEVVKFSASNFANFTDLRYLDLTGNDMKNISDDTFHNNTELTYLDLKFNLLGAWPDKAISVLINLRELYLDNTIVGTLGPMPKGFSQLTRLERLSISALRFGVVNETFFHYVKVSNIVYLDMSECVFSNIQAGAFKNFHHINELLLNAVVGLNLDNFQWIFADLNGSDLATVNLFGVDNITELGTDLFKYFKHNKLKTLILSYTGISTIRERAFENLNALTNLLLDNTQITSISGNMFLGLNSLTTLDISSTKINMFNFSDSGLKNLQLLNMSYTRYLFKMKSHGFYVLPNLRQLKIHSGAVEILENCTFCGLPKLETLEMTDANLEEVYPDAFTDLGSLTALDLTGSALRFLKKDLFKGMSALSQLILDGNEYNHSSKVEQDAFHWLTAIKNISMESCQLSSDYGLFRDLNSLEWLDLKDNTGIHIDEHAFCGMTNLKYLYISYIKSLKALPTALNDINLDYLEVSFDSLGNISTSNISYLTSTKMKTFSGAGNNYYCGCGQIKFLKWFNTTKKIVDDRSMYHCKDQRLDEFDLESCNHRNMLAYIISIPGGFSVILGIVVFIAYRYRWALRWKWYKFRLHKYEKLVQDYEDARNEQMDFDAFIAYSSIDYQFVLNQIIPNLERPPPGEKPFHLAIDFREFVPGAPIADNIIEHIDRSRKTVLLLSNNYIDGNWTLFEYDMAQSKKAKREDVIIVVMLESIHHRLKELPKTLVRLLKNKLYIEWTTDRDGQQLFWRKLRWALMERSISSLSRHNNTDNT